MSASRESSEFVDPAPRPPRADRSAEASTSRVTLTDSATTMDRPRIELLNGNDDDGADASASTTQAQINGDASANDGRKPASGKSTPSRNASPSSAKIFRKSTDPSVPLRIYLTTELPHTMMRKLTIDIRSHGGAVATAFAKSDLIVVDPAHVTSKKHLRDASQMGEPIPVVGMDYIRDSVSQGLQLNIDDPKYRFTGKDLHVAAGTARSKNGRNAFTESDRQAIIDYFIDKPQETWSLNTAARQLAAQIPTHSHASFQSYLQANFETGWNLKEKILAARRAAIEAEPSELQARIFRSQYTASPSLAEQSAPSDGWPRVSPPADAENEEADVSVPEAPASRSAVEASSQAEDDEEELQVRHPEPGSALDNVERSPTKVKQTVEYPSSEQSSLGTSPPPSLPPGQRLPGTQAYRSTPPVDEESDPEHFSPRILSELQREEASRQQPSQNGKQKGRRRRHSSESSDDSDLDQPEADNDEDLLATGSAPNQAAQQKEVAAENFDEAEWNGSRRHDLKAARQKVLEEMGQNETPIEYRRIRFTANEKEALPQKLFEHVLAQDPQLPSSTVDFLLAKPDDAFWNRLAAEHPTHSAASWRSHYLKNRQIYIDAIAVHIREHTKGDHESEEESQEEGNGSSSDREDAQPHSAQQDERLQTSDQAGPSTLAAGAADTHSQQRVVTYDGSHISDDISIPADGIVVMIPLAPSQRASRTPKTPVQAADAEEDEEAVVGEEDAAVREAENDVQEAVQDQVQEEQEGMEDDEDEWPEVPPPPPIEDEEDDAMQVEAETDAIPTSPALGGEDQEEDAFEPIESEVDVSSADDESDASAASEEPADGERDRSLSKAASPEIATPTRPAQTRTAEAVEAGTPVLAQHRAATFYDFTMDSDEEDRIRKARSRPSLPNPVSHQRDPSPRLRRSPITSQRVTSHFATPRRSPGVAAARRVQLSIRQQEDDRAQRTREWARSVSAESSSASPERVAEAEPVAVTESTRSRASRIDHAPMLGAARTAELTPTRRPDRPQQTSMLSAGRSPAALASESPRSVALRTDQVARRVPRPGIDAARQQYRAEVDRFRNDFGLDKAQLRNLLMRFNASVKDARSYIGDWLGEMEEAYGVDAAVASEYVKTSQGDFQQAETFLRLAAVIRSSNTPDRSRSSLTRSPSKRQARDDDRSFDRFDRDGARAGSAKRSRR
ncbi:BRCT domain protein [Kalmanozyma brasiliensis GHG001]|uniref:BRCT domain protein n=1 Tax=Kalmanozyma brasiliensis (strain GHG001) TaxID=1365824 RepID=UPI002868028C|nr:BRCT domain protein [Kalmanozyma brasiliensis GHG001]EST08913.2 BRCT domain protein [Kalmanozyma brasiliensis GHG001]